jgi:hypothetical protein
MVISHCLFLPTFENLADFQLGVCLQRLVLNRTTTHSREFGTN